MSRPLRFIPEEGSLVEVTCRTDQGRYLLRPDPAAILNQHPHTRPKKLKKSPAPLFHAASKEARQGLRAAYGLFLAAFREAAERLKAGDRLARFPHGRFPPALPFVGMCALAST